MSALNFKQFFHIWTQQLLNWLTVKFNSIDIDTSDLAKEANATTNKEAIITAVNNAQPDLSTVAKQGTNASATLTAVLEALTGGNEPSPDIPEGVAERLAMILEFFGIKTISGYTFMTETEITDGLEDIMQVLDNELTPEQAAAITTEAMQIIVRA